MEEITSRWECGEVLTKFESHLDIEDLIENMKKVLPALEKMTNLQSDMQAHLDLNLDSALRYFFNKELMFWISQDKGKYYVMASFDDGISRGIAIEDLIQEMFDQGEGMEPDETEDLAKKLEALAEQLRKAARR